jgi:hypothetical protein
VAFLTFVCLTGDPAWSLRCDCGSQLRSALRAIADADTGVLIYLRGHEGRGIGLGNKLRAYLLQQHEGRSRWSAGTVERRQDWGTDCPVSRPASPDTSTICVHPPSDWFTDNDD